MRQELTAPVTSVMGYAEILMEDAQRAQRAELVGDLKRILDASQALNRLVTTLLDPTVFQRHEGSANLDEFRRKLRHDLRTPINAIKGYGEMLREDAEDGGDEAVVADLDKLLAEATQLVDRIDGLVTAGDATPSEAAGTAGLQDDASARAVESVLASVRAVAASEANQTAEIPSRILVVDDNASNRDLLARRLQRQGHTVLQAEDGERALDVIATETLDLVLLDLMMPGISGYEVLTRLKADPLHRDLPVIMISALNELDSIVRCIEAGADDYLAKPFDPILLRARVGSSLDKKHLRDREREMVEALRVEKARSEQLLLNILPQAIVTRLNGGEAVIADQLRDVTILFADIVGFTRIASSMTAADLVRMLNGLFSEFDRLAVEHGVEKIKTVGDNYMLAGGLPDPRPDHAPCRCRHGARDAGRRRARQPRPANPPADAHRHPFRRRRGGRDRHPQVRLRRLGQGGEHRQPHGIARRSRSHHDLADDARAYRRPVPREASRHRRGQGHWAHGNLHSARPIGRNSPRGGARFRLQTRDRRASSAHLVV